MDFPEKEENKFIVFKRSDFDELCHVLLEKGHKKEAEKLLSDLQELIDWIGKYRASLGGERDPKYIVCNQDEHYAELVWQIILMGELQKEMKAWMEYKEEHSLGVCDKCGVVLNIKWDEQKKCPVCKYGGKKGLRFYETMEVLGP